MQSLGSQAFSCVKKIDTAYPEKVAGASGEQVASLCRACVLCVSHNFKWEPSRLLFKMTVAWIDRIAPGQRGSVIEAASKCLFQLSFSCLYLLNSDRLALRLTRIRRLRCFGFLYFWWNSRRISSSYYLGEGGTITFALLVTKPRRIVMLWSWFMSDCAADGTRFFFSVYNHTLSTSNLFSQPPVQRELSSAPSLVLRTARNKHVQVTGAEEKRPSEPCKESLSENTPKWVLVRAHRPLWLMKTLESGKCWYL